METEKNLFNDEIDFISVISVFFDNFNLLISIFLSSSLIISVFYLSSTNLYQSNSLLEVKNENSNLLSGSLSLSNPSSFSDEGSLKAEIEIYKSNDTITDALDKLKNENLFNNEELPSSGQVRNNLIITNTAKSLININFTSSNKELSKILLNKLNAEYIEDRKNFVKQSSSAGREFIQKEIPRIKLLLKTAENNLNNFKISTNTSDVIFDTNTRNSKLEELKARFNEISFKELELKEFYKETHPIYLTLLEQKKLVTLQLNEIEEDLPNVPSTQRALENFKREVDIYSNVLGELSSQELTLSMAEASSLSNVRIINTASDGVKTYPRLLIFLICFLILGISYLILLIRHFLGDKVTNFDALVDFVGKENIIGELPLFKETGNSNDSLYTNIADELLNKTIYEITHSENKGKTYSIVSSKKGAGKTEISKKIFNKLKLKFKVCLLDLDYRKRGLTNELKVDKTFKNFEEFLLEKDKFKSDNDSLFIPWFDIDNPPDFFTSNEFIKMIELLKNDYDYIICDTPPWRLFVDAKIISKYIDNHIYVVCNQSTTFKDIELFKKEIENSNNISYFYNKFRLYFNFLWYRYQYPYYSSNYYYDYLDYSNSNKKFTFISFLVKFINQIKDEFLKWIGR